MVIIFYNVDTEEVYICTDREKMKIVSINDQDILTHVPNDDILYVQNAHFITKKQFGDWLQGEGENFDAINSTQNNIVYQDDQNNKSKYENSKFIHPARNGAIHISDIKTDKFPNGIELVGKYDFVSIDDIGGFEVLEESHNFKFLLGKGKIEVVGYDYVKKHYNKKKSVSAGDAALERILIKNARRGTAESVAAAGGIGAQADITDSIEIFVD